MGEVEANELVDAARQYTRLRRRYWQFLLGGLAVLAVLAVLGATLLNALDPQFHPTLRGILICLLALAFLVCWVGSVVAWHSLMRFRCPRCGKRFVLSWSNSWPTAACKHCGLHLG